MQLFFTQNIHGNHAFFDEDEARHIAQVLRHKIGDVLQLTDGKGNLYDGTISEIGKKTCVVSIQNTQEAYNKRDFGLHIAIAPTKNIDRLEWFLEKTTEIGIDEITPIICARSERTVVKLDRLNGILLSAMKQSLKAYLPKLNEAIDFQKFIKKDFSNFNQKFIAHCYTSFEADDRTPSPEIAVKHPLSKIYQKGSNSVILIGPEGDFTEKEINLAIENRFGGISLGESRLRTETAGLVACHTVNLINEMF